MAAIFGWALGFDLSLSAPGACALPRDWKPGDWKRVKSWLFKPEQPATDDLAGQLRRYDEIARWAIAVIEECKGSRPPTCFVENYGFRKNNAQASRIMECGGVVKLAVFKRWGVTLIPVVAASGRKLFLGAVPKSDQKVAVQDFLFNKCGAPKVWDENQADAFVVANWGLCELGGTAIAQPPPPKKPRKR